MEQAMNFLVDEILFVTEDSRTKVRQEVEDSLVKMLKKKFEKEPRKPKPESK